MKKYVLHGVAIALFALSALQTQALDCSATPTCCTLSCGVIGNATNCTSYTVSSTCTAYGPSGAVTSSYTVYCPEFSFWPLDFCPSSFPDSN